MNINCPHCGTEYEIEKHEFGKFVTCLVCDKNFVAGVKQQGKSASPRSEPHDHQTSRQGGPLAGEFKSSDVNTRTVAEQYSDGDTKFITPSVAMVLQTLGYIGAILCGIVGIFISAKENGVSSEQFWISLLIIVSTIVACVFIRLWYEFVIIIFTGVAYLRQIRDELRSRRI